MHHADIPVERLSRFLIYSWQGITAGNMALITPSSRKSGKRYPALALNQASILPSEDCLTRRRREIVSRIAFLMKSWKAYSPICASTSSHHANKVVCLAWSLHKKQLISQIPPILAQNWKSARIHSYSRRHFFSPFFPLHLITKGLADN